MGVRLLVLSSPGSKLACACRAAVTHQHLQKIRIARLSQTESRLTAACLYHCSLYILRRISAKSRLADRKVADRWYRW